MRALQTLCSGILERLLIPIQLPPCRVLSAEGAEHGTCWVPQEYPGCSAQASTAYIPSWKTASLLTFTTVPVYTERAWPLSLQKEKSEGKRLSWCLMVPPTSLLIKQLVLCVLPTRLQSKEKQSTLMMAQRTRNFPNPTPESASSGVWWDTTDGRGSYLRLARALQDVHQRRRHLLLVLHAQRGLQHRAQHHVIVGDVLSKLLVHLHGKDAHALVAGLDADHGPRGLALAGVGAHHWVPFLHKLPARHRAHGDVHLPDEVGLVLLLLLVSLFV